MRKAFFLSIVFTILSLSVQSQNQLFDAFYKWKWVTIGFSSKGIGFVSNDKSDIDPFYEFEYIISNDTILIDEKRPTSFGFDKGYPYLRKNNRLYGYDYSTKEFGGKGYKLMSAKEVEEFSNSHKYLFEHRKRKMRIINGVLEPISDNEYLQITN
ncbi:MAG: hypothetical protein IKO46_09135 [Salinivirgaceae bacterium]|nr:hypothetical protein [Salinivirgaceae bacterium]